MKLKSLRNILVNGKHIAEGEVFDADTDTANALLATRKVRIAADLKKEEAAEKKAAKEAEAKAKEDADAKANAGKK